MTTRTPRRTRQWTGDSTTKDVQASAAVSVGATIALLPVVAAIGTQSDVTHKMTYLDFYIRRLTPAIVDHLSYVMWSGETLVSTATPAQPLDPASANSKDWANKDLMSFGGLPVPPCLIDSLDVLVVGREVLHVRREVPVLRKLSRMNHGVFLQLGAESADVLEVRVTWRTIFLT